MLQARMALRRRREIPTDLALLEAICERYYETYADYTEGARSNANKARESKVYVPIDIASLAHDMKAEPDLLFGRLYYYLQKKYGYSKDNTEVPFFTPGVGNKDKHCVHFPYLASVLAQMRDENKKHQVASWMAGISLGLSVVALVVSIMKG